MNLTKLSYKIAFFATILAFCVITLGAYTRLKDAGLGCPDWPGCYGQITAPATPTAQEKALEAYPGQAISVPKARTEMFHRYVAGTLSLLIVALFVIRLINHRDPKQPKVLPLVLPGLILFQALLGMWTVTLKLLPVVVMGHLLGGMTTLACLAWLTLKLKFNLSGKAPLRAGVVLRTLAGIALIALIAQMALGGWTSANYAAMICPDFPYCQGLLVPPLDFQAAFANAFHIGPNYQGGVLGNTARVTIHMLHRFGALVATALILMLGLSLLKQARKPLRGSALVLLALLAAQVFLGIMNVVAYLPLHIAVSHNACAALLLVTLVTINFQLKAAAHEPS